MRRRILNEDQHRKGTVINIAITMHKVQLSSNVNIIGSLYSTHGEVSIGTCKVLTYETKNSEYELTSLK